MSDRVIPGQRWISEMEPDLGLGRVAKIEGRFITLEFRASATLRQYAIATAPIKRVRFGPGDRITTQDGQELTVVQVVENQGLLIYQCKERPVGEEELSDSLSFSSPKERLFAGMSGSNSSFNNRYKSRQLYSDYLKSSARGFIGGRIQLIPHQLYVASEVAGRQIPRVLLSDEVGLGKTIEACLIIHRLLNNGRISRVLILVPESLVHQWFVELYRRFNLLFRIYDQEYCESLAEANPGDNIFLEEQLILASIDFLAGSKWEEQCHEAGWDMLIVDEAHHLQEGEQDYLFVEKLASTTKGLLLLTATPEQLGHKSHFARLRLLDPARFYNFEKFEREETQYLKIATMANKLIARDKLSQKEQKYLKTLLPNMATKGEVPDLQRVISDLLDRHGMGRIVFRNTRAAMPNFPERKAFLVPLDGEEDTGMPPNYDDDPRIDWLVDFIRKHRKTKVLLICQTLEKVFAIEKALQKKIQVKAALFHEELTLLQRDRNAAWFSEPDGAQLLICSEIGSEGRNFQFTNTLVLFDLPGDPELLEQRIGRLDRIGQKKTIQIHVPYLTSGPHQVLVRWYHEGLGAFEKNVPGVFQIYQQVRDELEECLENPNGGKVDQLLKRTAQIRETIVRQMEQGRDRLLELHSFDPEAARVLLRSIKSYDESPQLEEMMLTTFEEYGVHYRDLHKRTYELDFRVILKPDFPIPPAHQEGMTITFDRTTALNREEVTFLSWDHPMVIGLFDVALASEHGNCALALWPEQGVQELLLEAVFIVECVAPKQMHIDRFLPPVPVRVLVNHARQNLTDKYPPDRLAKKLRRGAESLLDNPDIKQHVLGMLETAEEIASGEMAAIVRRGREDIEETFGHEITRLEQLAKINPNIPPGEIEAWKGERDALTDAVNQARLRLDALRIIYHGIPG